MNDEKKKVAVGWTYIMQKRLCRRKKEDDIKKVHEMKVKGKRNPGCPKHRWHDTIRKDIQSCSLKEKDTPESHPLL